jgi:hypothetical protein
MYSVKDQNFINVRTTGGGEGPREGGRAIGGGEACRGGKVSGDEVRRTAKTLDDVLTGDVDPVRGDENSRAGD